MRRTRLFWRIFPSLMAISVGLMVVLYLLARRSLEEFYWQEVSDALKIHARLAAEPVSELLKRGDAAGVDALVNRLGKANGIRLTVTLPSGKVVADSDEKPDRMEDHHNRPEIAAALRSGDFGQTLRRSPTLQE